MKVLHNVVDLETGRIHDVLLRNITEPFWMKVLEATNESRVCVVVTPGIVGTPGIGKTTTSPIVLRFIFEQSPDYVTVIYDVRTLKNDDYVYIFTRRGGINAEIKTEVIPQKSFQLSNYNDKSTYYVVDPGQKKDSCNPLRDFKGKVIIVSSPDDGHWVGRLKF
jgi:DUF1365 family protein